MAAGSPAWWWRPRQWRPGGPRWPPQCDSSGPAGPAGPARCGWRRDPTSQLLLGRGHWVGRSSRRQIKDKVRKGGLETWQQTGVHTLSFDVVDNERKDHFTPNQMFHLGTVIELSIERWPTENHTLNPLVLTSSSNNIRILCTESTKISSNKIWGVFKYYCTSIVKSEQSPQID